MRALVKFAATSFTGATAARKSTFPVVRRYPGAHPKFSNVVMQIVSSGPDSQWQNIRNGYFKVNY